MSKIKCCQCKKVFNNDFEELLKVPPDNLSQDEKEDWVYDNREEAYREMKKICPDCYEEYQKVYEKGFARLPYTDPDYIPKKEAGVSSFDPQSVDLNTVKNKSVLKFEKMLSQDKEFLKIYSNNHSNEKGIWAICKWLKENRPKIVKLCKMLVKEKLHKYSFYEDIILRLGVLK